MNKVFTYIALCFVAVCFVACSNDDNFDGTNNGNGGDFDGMDVASRVAIQNFVNGGGDSDESYPLAKSSLYYQFSDKTMAFDWDVSDEFSVFYVDDTANPDGTECSIFDVDTEEDGYKITSADNKKVTVLIKPKDEATFPRYASSPYVSFMPYIPQDTKNGNFSYMAVPVHYDGQIQTANMKILKYYNRSTDTETMNEYIQSEKDAAAHLSEYDYMCSNIISTKGAHVQFDFQRMGSIIRFWMKAPLTIKSGVLTPETFDSLQVVNEKSKFLLQTTMNAKTGEFNATPQTRKHYVQSLKFGSTGFTFDNLSSDYCYKNIGYIVAYMMLAPIDLSEDDTYVYLCGHRDITETAYNAISDELEKAQYVKVNEDLYRKKTYYKSNKSMTKLNFEANKNYQWTIVSEEDDPIKFEAISVQEWKDGTTFTNGEQGSGTEGW